MAEKETKKSTKAVAKSSKATNTKSKAVKKPIKVASKKVVASKSAAKKTAKPEIEIPALEDFLKAGAHFGHEVSLWNPKMLPYIYDERNKIHILDLIKTMKLLKKALEAIQDYSENGHVLVVGTKGQASRIVKEACEKAGAFYVDKRWPGGLFTNFGVMRKSFKKLRDYEETVASMPDDLLKKEILAMKKEAEKMNKLYGGIKLLDRLPALLVVIDTKIEKKAVAEANKVGVPVVALMDTNCSPDGVDYVVPANDDSIRSIKMFVELFSKAIKGSKHANSLISMRVDYYTRLQKIRAEREAEIARRVQMEEEERQRLKKLRAAGGKKVEEKKDSEGRVVRVIKESK